MTQRLTLADLIQEHFDGVLATLDHGRWGSWVLDRAEVERGRLLVVHDESGYAVEVGAAADWVALVARADWATASDVGELIQAIRDLEYARWLGLAPASASVPAVPAS